MASSQDVASPAAAGKEENNNTAAAAPALPDIVSAYPVPPLDYFTRYFHDDVFIPPVSLIPESDGNEDREERVEAPRFPSPPPVPSDRSVESFGCFLTPTDHVMRELEDQGIDRLGAEEEKRNQQQQLKRLMWSAISKFFEVLDCLIRDPSSEQRTELTADLQTIFINLHHTVNQYRLPQGHESLVELLKFQTLRNVKQSESLLEGMTKALDIVEGSGGVVENSDMPTMEGVIDDGPTLNDDDNGVNLDVLEFRRVISDLQLSVVEVRELFSSAAPARKIAPAENGVK
ncbi:hypothetical protein BV898_03770 [Hypsibius exemplaris]|uniref:Mediator of RNA polymerase II transcription subunit 7 n=1 Tax=Hypsibius exemplaris TaxID=2072580 RepID=A0A1W0X3Y5_HYPEX|nr:hypothetical protein BV898_03770 [Hypsibius exemplaris]